MVDSDLPQDIQNDPNQFFNKYSNCWSIILTECCYTFNFKDHWDPGLFTCYSLFTLLISSKGLFPMWAKRTVGILLFANMLLWYNFDHMNHIVFNPPSIQTWHIKSKVSNWFGTLNCLTGLEIESPGFNGWHYRLILSPLFSFPRMKSYW